jgi:hypothetical protein
MEENEDMVECTLCNDLFDRSACRKELNLGWVCRRCADDLAARGEGPVFKEDNYWDFLDEKLDLDIDFSQVIDSSDMEIWGVESAGEDTYKAVLLKRFENVPFRGGRDEIEKVESEMFDLGGLFVFHFGKDGLPRLGRWDPELLNSLGNCEIIFDNERYDRAVEETLNGSASKREALESEELHDLGNEYDGGYPLDTPELPEADEPLTFEEEYLEESDNPKESNEPILGTIGYFVYDKQDKQVAGPFDKIYDATAWANRHNQPIIKVQHCYYYPDDEEELFKLEPHILKSDL